MRRGFLPQTKGKKAPPATKKRVLSKGQEETAETVLTPSSPSEDSMNQLLITAALPESGGDVCECLLFPETLDMLDNLRGFPYPMDQPLLPAYRITRIEGKGLAMVSTRFIAMGDVIMSERPLIIVPAQGILDSDCCEVSINRNEGPLSDAVNRMLPENKAAFWALHNCHKDDGRTDAIAGIMLSNAISIGGLPPGHTYMAVCDHVSRINHSCTPNSYPVFHVPSLSYRVFALCDIAAGDEITWQYIDIRPSAAERSKALEPYKFQCTIAAFEPSVLPWAVFNRHLPDDWLINQCKQNLELLRSEKMWERCYHKTLLKLMESYICLGDAENASLWARKLIKCRWQPEKEQDESFENETPSAVRKIPPGCPFTLTMNGVNSGANGRPAFSVTERGTEELRPAPYGKQKKIVVPEGYGSTLKITEKDPLSGSDPNPDSMTCTTMPQTGDTIDERHLTECLFFSGSKEVLLSIAGFPHEMQQPSEAAHRVGPAGDKGLGMFSTRLIGAGELIMSERPLAILPRGMPTPVPPNFTQKQAMQLAMDEHEQMCAIAVNRLLPEAKAAFWALTNTHKEDGSGPIAGIMRTNGIAAENLRPGVQSAMGIYSAVCKEISRMNHSCRPNTQPVFHPASLSFRLYAVRDIPQGEELTFAYTNIQMPAGHRNRALRPYQFTCRCSACLNAKLSDKRRKKIAGFAPDVRSWAADHTLTDDWLIVQCREQLERIDSEGFEADEAYYDALKTLMEFYLCLGDAENAAVWADKMEQCRWTTRRFDSSSATLQKLSLK
ncbi:unnamed protein product [Mycena citricolor]|uniref:SET domain-containing protein n=1 Tax=Mycena citricolor TaxID=2018698 RepID=A0AAD2HVG5_9AGAR|nr:unnamed protein product [Mycena citricolor]